MRARGVEAPCPEASLGEDQGDVLAACTERIPYSTGSGFTTTIVFRHRRRCRRLRLRCCRRPPRSLLHARCPDPLTTSLRRRPTYIPHSTLPHVRFLLCLRSPRQPQILRHRRASRNIVCVRGPHLVSLSWISMGTSDVCAFLQPAAGTKKLESGDAAAEGTIVYTEVYSALSPASTCRRLPSPSSGGGEDRRCVLGAQRSRSEVLQRRTTCSAQNIWLITAGFLSPPSHPPLIRFAASRTPASLLLPTAAVHATMLRCSYLRFLAPIPHTAVYVPRSPRRSESKKSSSEAAPSESSHNRLRIADRQYLVRLVVGASSRVKRPGNGNGDGTGWSMGWCTAAVGPATVAASACPWAVSGLLVLCAALWLKSDGLKTCFKICRRILPCISASPSPHLQPRAHAPSTHGGLSDTQQGPVSRHDHLQTGRTRCHHDSTRLLVSSLHCWKCLGSTTLHVDVHPRRPLLRCSLSHCRRRRPAVRVGTNYDK
ncbi:hypothetical protein C8R45DRAFT_118370 [Mycena sanguinolenta]|nr:hypothetical protein C8R45DRAFT_159995 [Mycena sanguinolenta]KAJ6450683.1 hypothetical protein C8R45DRAFT_118370 [Mycena sanguinolenta]